MGKEPGAVRQDTAGSKAVNLIAGPEQDPKARCPERCPSEPALATSGLLPEFWAAPSEVLAGAQVVWVWLDLLISIRHKPEAGRVHMMSVLQPHRMQSSRTTAA